MDKSNGIEIVQGDKLEAEFYLVGSTPISKYFVTEVKLAKDYTYSSTGNGQILKDGSIVFAGNNSIVLRQTSENLINICITIDQNNIVKAPSALTQCIDNGYYSYDIVCMYQDDILTPVYCNTFSVYGRVNEFPVDPEPITQGVRFSDTFYYDSGSLSDVSFFFVKDSKYDGRSFYRESDARGLEFECNEIKVNGYYNDGSSYTVYGHIGSSFYDIDTGESANIQAGQVLIIDRVVCNK